MPNYGPKIVTDGLTLYLDAANRKSYPGTGTTWYDLSPSQKNGTLSSNLTYSNTNNGSIVFDSVNDNVITTSFAPTYTDFSVGVWFKFVNDSAGTYSRLVDQSYTNGFWLGKNGSTANSWGGGIKESDAPYGIYITLTDGSWHYIVSVRSGTTHTIYGDGNAKVASNTVTSSSLDSASIRIGNTADLTNDFNGNIAVVQMYDRALTESEIVQNFNATKGRFGL